MARQLRASAFAHTPVSHHNPIVFTARHGLSLFPPIQHLTNRVSIMVKVLLFTPGTARTYRLHGGRRYPLMDIPYPLSAEFSAAGAKHSQVLPFVPKSLCGLRRAECRYIMHISRIFRRKHRSAGNEKLPFQVDIQMLFPRVLVTAWTLYIVRALTGRGKRYPKQRDNIPHMNFFHTTSFPGTAGFLPPPNLFCFTLKLSVVRIRRSALLHCEFPRRP